MEGLSRGWEVLLLVWFMSIIFYMTFFLIRWSTQDTKWANKVFTQVVVNGSGRSNGGFQFPGSLLLKCHHSVQTRTDTHTYNMWPYAALSPGSFSVCVSVCVCVLHWHRLCLPLSACHDTLPSCLQLLIGVSGIAYRWLKNRCVFERIYVIWPIFMPACLLFYMCILTS